MPEKLRFRQASKIVLTEEDEAVTRRIKTELPKETTKAILEYPVYDVILESVSPPLKLQLLNTEVKKTAKRQAPVTLIDLPIERGIRVEKIKMVKTEVARTEVSREVSGIVDVSLVEYKVHRLPDTMNTEVFRNMQREVTRGVMQNIFDISLKTEIALKQLQGLNTEVDMLEASPSIEILRSMEETQLPILEEFIESDGRFPRSFAESFSSPFILLIGEDEREWHIPIIYVLEELFREITDRHPKVTFREPEILEESMEEHVDSIDPHSLEQFTFEHKIEFLDARMMRVAVEEFAKIVRGRLNSAFLQQFGILVIAVRRKDLEEARNILKVKGIRVYSCSPDDAKYELFCSKVLGISPLGTFFNNLKARERCLSQTIRRFSVFVRRGADATDRFQYPLKVATFVYLLNELRKRKKELINNFEGICKFVKEVIDKEIQVEEEIAVGGRKVVPDLIYFPEEEKIFIEIETLIETLEPMKKIDETIEKYKDYQGANVWIILNPASALLHYEELKARKKVYEVLYKDMRVEFKVLTLLTSKNKFRWELVSLDKFVEGVKLAKRVQREG